MRNDDGHTFVSKISPSGTEIFQDPMGELARKRQVYLLISSILTILLTLTVISPVESEIAGLKVNINSPEVISKVGGWVTLYLAVVYGINVFQDIKIFQYRQMRNWSLIRILTNEIIQSYVKIINPETLQERTNIVAKKYIARNNELLSRRAAMSTKADTSSLFAINAWFSQQKQEEDVYNKEVEHNLSEMRKELDTLGNSTKNALDAEFQKTETIKKLSKEYTNLSNLRFLVEILFPLILAAVAVWKSLIP